MSHSASVSQADSYISFPYGMQNGSLTDRVELVDVYNDGYLVAVCWMDEDQSYHW
jgi:hypothetical protein